MADLTSSNTAFNSAVEFTLNDAEASQTVDMSDAADEGAVIIVENANTDAAQTATITVSKGEFDSAVLGDLVATVAYGEAAVIGPLEGVRFKNSVSKITIGAAVTGSGTLSNVKLAVVKLP